MIRNVTVQVAIAAAAAILLALAFGNPAWLESPTPFYQFILMLKAVFLALLKMLIAPMIFFSLVGGIISIGSVIKLRTMGGVTVVYYLATTGIAIAMAMFVVFFVAPWTNYPPTLADNLTLSPDRMIDPNSDSIVMLIQQVFTMAFTNPFTALAELNILGIVANAFLIGIATVLVLPAESPVFTFIQDVNKVIMKVLGWVILLLPIGIFAILFDFTVKLNAGTGYGGQFLTQLLQFGLVVVVLKLVHGLLVLPSIGWIFTGRNPISFLRSVSQPLIVAFSTSSSAATLPVSMHCAETELKTDKSVSSFVLPLGATMNMDGTALFEALAAIFLAYLYGIELTSLAMVTVFIMAMVASIGAPGMPSASLAGMQMVLLAVGIPLEAIAILLVIERPLDAVRTAINVEGDLVGATVVQRYMDSRD